MFVTTFFTAWHQVDRLRLMNDASNSSANSSSNQVSSSGSRLIRGCMEDPGCGSSCGSVVSVYG